MLFPTQIIQANASFRRARSLLAIIREKRTGQKHFLKFKITLGLNSKIGRFFDIFSAHKMFYCFAIFTPCTTFYVPFYKLFRLSTRHRFPAASISYSPLSKVDVSFIFRSGVSKNPSVSPSSLPPTQFLLNATQDASGSPGLNAPFFPFLFSVPTTHMSSGLPSNHQTCVCSNSLCDAYYSTRQPRRCKAPCYIFSHHLSFLEPMAG